MTQERSDSSRARSRPGHRFKPRELSLGDGERLVLDSAGSIALVAEDGTIKQSWAADDPEWPQQAIRFGLQSPAATPNPHGRDVRQERPPRR